MADAAEMRRLAATADDGLLAVIPERVMALLDEIVEALFIDLGESPEAVRGAALTAGVILRTHVTGIEVSDGDISRSDLMTVAFAYRIVRHPLAMQVLTG